MKKYPTMVRVIKEKIDGVCGRIKENIREASKFLEGDKSEQREENMDKAMIMKLKLERTLQKLVEMVGEIETQKLAIKIEDYDKCQYDTEDKLSELEVFIMNHKGKQKSIIKQQEKRMEMELREKKEVRNGAERKRKETGNGAERKKKETGNGAERKGKENGDRSTRNGEKNGNRDL